MSALVRSGIHIFDPGPPTICNGPLKSRTNLKKRPIYCDTVLSDFTTALRHLCSYLYMIEYKTVMTSPSNLIKNPKSAPHYVASSPDKKIYSSQLKSYQVSNLPSIERRNWLIHLHFVRKDFDVCKSLIQEQLEETNNLCEYALYTKAKILRCEGKVRESAELFQHCCKLDKSAENLKQVGRSLYVYLLGRKLDAIEAYSEALNIDSENWEIIHNLGLCYLDLKDYGKAKDKFLKAIQVYPHSDSFECLGKIFLEKGELNKAIETYKKAIESMGNQQKAFEHLVSIPALSVNNLKGQFASGSILQSHGDVDEALDRYRNSVSKMPDSSFLWNNIGMCFYSKKKYVAAISCLKRASYLAPSEWKIHYNLGLVHLTMQQYASAFNFLSAANKLKPNHPDTYMLLAEDYETAKTAFEQAISLGKNELVTPLNYAIFLDEIGEKTNAVNQLQVYQSRLTEMTKNNEKPDSEILDLAAKIKKSFQISSTEDS
ncbi:Bardet-Biedl syndrome 4 protein [Nymphon striatum]|nr:Bardet-Biedl syndrome 4 protein [Nymphon striatum]